MIDPQGFDLEAKGRFLSDDGMSVSNWPGTDGRSSLPSVGFARIAYVRRTGSDVATAVPRWARVAA